MLGNVGSHTASLPATWACLKMGGRNPQKVSPHFGIIAMQSQRRHPPRRHLFSLFFPFVQFFVFAALFWPREKMESKGTNTPPPQPLTPAKRLLSDPGPGCQVGHTLLAFVALASQKRKERRMHYSLTSPKQIMGSWQTMMHAQPGPPQAYVLSMALLTPVTGRAISLAEPHSFDGSVKFAQRGHLGCQSGRRHRHLQLLKPMEFHSLVATSLADILVDSVGQLHFFPGSGSNPPTCPFDPPFTLLQKPL